MSDYLKPKVGTPSLEPKQKNGMFINHPGYPEMGGFTGPSKLNKTNKSIMELEKGGPQSKRGKPL
jgi:hypothetical protein